MSRCLHCEESATTRGLCYACYQRAWRFVKSKKSTWEELETSGYVLKSRRPFGRSAISEAKTIDEQNLAALKIGNKATIEARQPLIRQLERQIELGTPSLSQRIQGEFSIGQPAPTPKVPDPVSEPMLYKSPNPLAGAPPAQSDYDPPIPPDCSDTEAPVGCGAPVGYCQSSFPTLIPGEDLDKKLRIMMGPDEFPPAGCDSPVSPIPFVKPWKEPLEPLKRFEGIRAAKIAGEMMTSLTEIKDAKEVKEKKKEIPALDGTVVIEPDLEVVKASMVAIKEGRVQPVENFFRDLPDLHSGQIDEPELKPCPESEPRYLPPPHAG